MASFAAQAALRAKWSSLVEEHSIEVPPEVTSKVTSVVGWLKQVTLFTFHLHGIERASKSFHYTHLGAIFFECFAIII